MLDTRKMLSDVNDEMARLGKIRELLMMESVTDLPPLVTRPTRMTKSKGEDRLPPTVYRYYPMRPASGSSGGADKSLPGRKKHRLSAKGRAAISAATKKRWAVAKKKGLQMNGQPLISAKKKAAKAPKSQRQPAPV